MGPLNINNTTAKNDKLKKDILSKDVFSIVYQPKVELKNKNIISWEILSRWEHPEFGFISPKEFLNIIKELDREYEFDISVFEKMCRDISQMNYKDNTYSVNISINTLKNENLYNDIINISKKYNINHKQITLEILETDDIDKYDVIVDNTQKLDKIGFNISIDDFGTGYSSYHRLCNLTFKEIKIPREFLPTINDNEDKKIKILKGIISMGKSLGCTIVMEGIETLKDHNLAIDLGVDYAQGYLYSQPVPFNRYSKMISL